MKCQICKEKIFPTDFWGYYSFPICDNCYHRLLTTNPNNPLQVMNVIFKCGQIRNKIAQKELENEREEE